VHGETRSENDRELGRPMSWEILVQDLPNVANLEDVPNDFRPGSIGTRTELIARIKKVAPSAEEQDGWLFVQNAEVDLSIQFHMEDPQLVRYLMIHVHGGANSKARVAGIIEKLGLRAVDVDTGELFKG